MGICQHDRRESVLRHACQLCGERKERKGCAGCGTHVCIPCLNLARAGWPTGQSRVQRAQQRRNHSIRGKAEIKDKMEHVVTRMDRLGGGDMPRAALALWVYAHSRQEGSAAQFLLAPWL